MIEDQASTIHATVDMADAADTLWDVAVLGAGPAGAIAAGQLARQGVRVLLVDKSTFPRDKVCGCCVSEAAVRMLRSSGWGEATEGVANNRLCEITLAAGRQTVAFPLSGGLAVSRRLFDARLVRRAISWGAHFIPKCSATIGNCDREARIAILRSGDQKSVARARLILVATGLRTQLPDDLGQLRATPSGNKIIGCCTRLSSDQSSSSYQRGVIYMACDANAYVGVVQLEDGRLDVAAAFENEILRTEGGCGTAAARVLHRAGLPSIRALTDARWQGTPTLTRRPPDVAGPRVFLIGDAAGYVEPLTGEGIAWAIASALAVAPIAREFATGNWTNSAERRWRTAHTSLLRRPQLRCRLVTALARRPWVIRGVLGVANAMPKLRGAMVRVATSSQLGAIHL